jgi:hypothetical protein
VVRDDPGGPPGKLIAAARRWASGGGRDERVEAAAAMGLALEVEEEADLPIWPECWEALGIFLDLPHGWRSNGMGLLWLDPAAVRWRMAMAGRELDLELWRDLATLEMAAREALAPPDR